MDFYRDLEDLCWDLLDFIGFFVRIYRIFVRIYWIYTGIYSIFIRIFIGIFIQIFVVFLRFFQYLAPILKGWAPGSWKIGLPSKIAEGWYHNGQNSLEFRYFRGRRRFGVFLRFFRNS